MKCVGNSEDWKYCEVEKRGCVGCHYYRRENNNMEIKVYLHRTKKKNFEVADCFSVFVDLDKLPEDKKEDLNFINQGFENDCRRIAHTRECIQRFGTGYISFMRPQYEGPEEGNGNDKIYFDNQFMQFMSVKDKPKKKRSRKTKEEQKDVN